jgi:hypothetical protein
MMRRSPAPYSALIRTFRQIALILAAVEDEILVILIQCGQFADQRFDVLCDAAAPIVGQSCVDANSMQKDGSRFIKIDAPV